MSATQFEDLPLVADEADMRRVHHATALYFVSQAGKLAHAEMDCMHVAPYTETIPANPRWRVATDIQCRALRIGWCETCCSV